MRDEQVLLRDHAHRNRAIRIAARFQDCSRRTRQRGEATKNRCDGAAQKTQQRNVDLIVAGGRDQAQNQHRRARTFAALRQFTGRSIPVDYTDSRRAEARAPSKPVAGGLAGGLQFLQHSAATFADRGITLVLADMGRVIPATLALGAIGFLHLDVYAARAVAGGLNKRYRRDDEEVAKLTGVAEPAPNKPGRPQPP